MVLEQDQQEEEKYTTLVDIPVTKAQVENCTFSHWHPKFKKYTPKCVIIPSLPDSFIQYLEQDGIKLPHDCLLYTSRCV